MNESFIVSEDVGMAAVDSGESGYLHVLVDYPGVHWKVLSHDLSLIEESDDLHVPLVGVSPDKSSRRFLQLKSPAHEALSALVSFLLACAEARDSDSENYDLFEPDTREWAKQNSDALKMLAIELEEESS